MPKPVTNVLPAQPAGPKPVWQRTELFIEPAGLPLQDFEDQDDDLEAADL